MEDTTRESRRLVREVLMSKTVEERFLISALMYEDAREIARLGMPEGLSEDEQKAYIFRRLHGSDPEDLVRTETNKK